MKQITYNSFDGSFAEVATGRNGYWPKWSSDEVVMDEMALAEMSWTKWQLPRLIGYNHDNGPGAYGPGAWSWNMVHMVQDHVVLDHIWWPESHVCVINHPKSKIFREGDDCYTTILKCASIHRCIQ